MDKKKNEQHDKNEERRGANPEKVEARRASTRREGGPKGGARRNGGPKGRGPEIEKVRAPRVGSEGGPEGLGPSAWGLEGWGPKISRFFSLPPPFSLFLSLRGSSRGIFLVGFWAAGVSHDSQRTPNVQI